MFKVNCEFKLRFLFLLVDPLFSVSEILQNVTWFDPSDKVKCFTKNTFLRTHYATHLHCVRFLFELHNDVVYNKICGIIMHTCIGTIQVRRWNAWMSDLPKVHLFPRLLCIMADGRHASAGVCRNLRQRDRKW